MKTIVGNSLHDYTKEPVIDTSVIATDNQIAAKIKWQACPETSHDEDVLRPIENPFNPQGGLQLLTGNLGHAVIKVSAVQEQHQVVTAPAKVFNSQAGLQDAYARGELETDFLAVI